MAQRGEQMRVGAHKGFAQNSLKVILLANDNRYEVDTSKCFSSGKALYSFKVMPSSNFDYF
jgi:hypothetical protein